MPEGFLGEDAQSKYTTEASSGIILIAKHASLVCFSPPNSFSARILTRSQNSYNTHF
jgi:hypothetical protein